jgi:hypothetical protein
MKRIACGAALAVIGLSVPAPGAIPYTVLNSSAAAVVDSDGDGVADLVDNAPGASNPGQEDNDADLIGNIIDLSPSTPNPGSVPISLTFSGPTSILAGQDWLFSLTPSDTPIGGWGQLAFTLGTGSQAYYLGPLTGGSPQSLSIPASLYTTATWDLNTPGTYQMLVQAGGPGVNSSQQPFQVEVVATPEPGTAAFLAAAGFILVRRRRERS